MNRTLIASINGAVVGHVRDEGGYWTFQYADSWLNNPAGFPISPALPLALEKFSDTSTLRAVAWFFDNLLPEESAREVLAKDAKVTIDDAWGLLAYFGAESAGAITLLPEGSEVASAGHISLSDADLQQRIDQMPQRSLSANAPKRMSLAGAQHKLAVSLINGELFEPIGDECSTHILKPDSKNIAYPHTAVNEHFCMRLASALKITVPLTEVRRVPSPVFLIERFDRAISRATCAMPCLDALQLLSLDRHLKYPKASAATLKECIDKCGAVLKTKQAIFAWVVFNVLIGNADAHMKNISFIVDSSGIRLAPFYDLVSTVVYATPEYDREGPHWPNVGLSMPIGQATSYPEVTRFGLLQVADELELGSKVALRILNELIKTTEPAAVNLLTNSVKTATPGEQRLLSLIYQLPIKEMSKRLS